jgi:hypothetical protein
METAPGSRTDARLPRAARVCRRCREPVTVQGDPQWGKAVHTATGKETGPGGHVAAPIDADLVRAAIARGADERP